MTLYARNDQGEVVEVISRRRVHLNEEAVVLAVLAAVPAITAAEAGTLAVLMGAPTSTQKDKQTLRGADPEGEAGHGHSRQAP